jgi:hypothetical protein
MSRARLKHPASDTSIGSWDEFAVIARDKPDIAAELLYQDDFDAWLIKHGYDDLAEQAHAIRQHGDNRQAALHALIAATQQTAAQAAATGDDAMEQKYPPSGNHESDILALVKELRRFGATTTPAASAENAPFQRKIESAVRSVLGQLPRRGDARAFEAALSRSFADQGQSASRESRQPSVVTSTGEARGLTAGQASLYLRAKIALDNSLPRLDRLEPLLTNTDPQQIEATRRIIRNSFTRLVDELGREGYPRQQRVDEQFDLLLGSRDLGQVGGKLGDLARLFFFGSGEQRSEPNVNDLDELQQLTDYRLIEDFLTSLREDWERFKDEPETDLSTRLFFLRRELAAIVDSAGDLEYVMDAAGLDEAERETLIFVDRPRTSVADWLSWLRTFAAEEAPRDIEDGGQEGVRTLAGELDELNGLAGALKAFDDSRIAEPDVQRELSELQRQLSRARQLTGADIVVESRK